MIVGHKSVLDDLFEKRSRLASVQPSRRVSSKVARNDPKTLLLICTTPGAVALSKNVNLSHAFVWKKTNSSTFDSYNEWSKRQPMHPHETSSHPAAKSSQPSQSNSDISFLFNLAATERNEIDVKRVSVMQGSQSLPPPPPPMLKHSNKWLVTIRSFILIYSFFFIFSLYFFFLIYFFLITLIYFNTFFGLL